MTLQLDWLRGCATALVTPFTSDGAVDEKRLRELMEYQIAGGVRVLVPCGTTGESVTMSDDENRLVIRTTVELSRGRAKVCVESFLRGLVVIRSDGEHCIDAGLARRSRALDRDGR